MIMFTFTGWSFVGMSLLNESNITKYWSFIGMSLINMYLCWCEFAQSLTSKASTSKGKSPYKGLPDSLRGSSVES